LSIEIMAKEPSPPDVTAMLLAWQQGDEKALEGLIPMVYDELHRLARARLRAERRGHVLQTTALVHEAYLRLVDINRMNVRDRSHLLAMAARLMRQILVDHARRRTARKRGGRVTVIGLDDVSIPNAEPGIDVLALDEALDELTRMDARLCRVVELKYFSGLTIDETAETLQVSPATVERDWAVAKAWLHQRLSSSATALPNQ
jgi:RNA polymerase sigma factor (TIGR02999 family)